LGLRDGEVDATLAHLAWGTDPALACRFAQTALESPLLSAESRVNALFALASNRSQNKQYEEAVRYVDELTKIRRHSADWSLLGDCRLALGDAKGAVEAFEAAVAINPNLVPIRETLCRLYQQQGNSARVAKHRRIIEKITAIDQRLRNAP
jgi:tetratricopeptide (TPR) repeat protein